MAAEEARPLVLLVDDDPLVLSAHGRVLRSLPIELLRAQSPEEGLRLLEEREEVAVVLADYRMPGMRGDQFLEAVMARWPRTVRLLCTALQEHEVIVEATARGLIAGHLPKPCDVEVMRRTVEEALARYRSQLLEG